LKGGLKVRGLLIVQDDTIYAALLARSMRVRGYAVDAACDVAEAHSKIA